MLFLYKTIKYCYLIVGQTFKTVFVHCKLYHKWLAFIRQKTTISQTIAMKQNVTIYLLYFVLFITSDLIYLSSSEPLSSEMLNSREGDRLAVATSNSVIVIRLLKDSLITSKDLQMATVIQANDYNAEIFSISYKDNLILYGKDSILAKPIE